MCSKPRSQPEPLTALASSSSLPRTLLPHRVAGPFFRREKHVGQVQPSISVTPGPRGCAAKNLHLCRVDAFENPLLSVGALSPGFGSHYAFGGLASAGLIDSKAPCGCSIGSSKVTSVHEHRRGLGHSTAHRRGPQEGQRECVPAATTG